MEALTLFASSVIGIGVTHLLFSTVNRFGKGIYYHGAQQQKRADWYCFFRPSVLLGEDLDTDETMNIRQQIGTEAEQRERMRRRQANRPRLQV